MKYIIRLTESELYRVVSDITARILREDTSLTNGAQDRLIGSKSIPVRNQDKVKGDIENTSIKFRKDKKDSKSDEQKPQVVQTDTEENEPKNPEYRYVINGFNTDYMPKINPDRDDLGLSTKNILRTREVGPEGDDVIFGDYDKIKVAAATAGHNYSIDNVLRRGRENHDKGAGISIDNTSDKGNNKLELDIYNSIKNEHSNENLNTILRELIPKYLKGRKCEFEFGNETKIVSFKQDKRVSTATNVLLDFFMLGEDMPVNEKFEVLHKKYDLKERWLRLMIISAINILRDSSEFEKEIKDALGGNYDVVNGKLTNLNNNIKHAKKDKSELKPDYIGLINFISRDFFRNKRPKIKLPDDNQLKFDFNEFVFIIKLINNVNDLSDSTLRQLKKQYDKKFYNKWKDYIK